MIIEGLREIKNRVAGNSNAINFFLRVINLPVIGSVYDEVYLNYIRNKIEKHPISVTIEPNNICNLRCVMCPYKDSGRKKETMPMPLFKKIADEAAGLGCREIHLTQYNEPFTDKFIFERIKYIRDKGMRSSFYSNAVLLNKEMRKKLLDNPPDWVRFSVDSVNKRIFEEIRTGSNYEEVVKNIISLYREREDRNQELPKIEVFFTVMDKNKNESKKFLKFWKGKCDFASLYPADSRGSEKYVMLKYKNLKSYPCFNPKRVLILSNGKVTLCCVDIDGKIELGDTKKQTLKEILSSKRYKEIYKSQLKRKCKIGMCKNCSKYYIDSAFYWWFYD